MKSLERESPLPGAPLFGTVSLTHDPDATGMLCSSDPTMKPSGL